MSQYPDATLGRVQDGGFNSAQQALTSIRQGISNDVNSLNNIIGQWLERKERKEEAQREREWNEAQAKLRMQHETDLTDKRINYEAAEHERNRTHKSLENEMDRTHKSLENDKTIKAQKEMNLENNLTSRYNTNAEHNAAVIMSDLDKRDRNGNLLINSLGQVVVNKKKAKQLGINDRYLNPYNYNYNYNTNTQQPHQQHNAQDTMQRQ